MTQSSTADIDAILLDRFPTRVWIEAVASFADFQQRTSKSTAASNPAASSALAKKAEVEAYRAHLASLPAHELAALAAQSRDRLAAQAAAERARNEAARFYNQPSAKAEFEFWCKADYWTADEAAALLLGRDPRAVNPETLATELKKPAGLFSQAKPPAAFHRQYDGLRTLLQRANGMQGADLTPSAAMEWAMRTKAVNVPSALAVALAIRADATATPNAVPTPALPGGTPVKWAPEMLERLQKFRKQHGTKAAAKEFGISATRVRQLLPGSDDKPAMASPFSVLKHRIK